MSLIDGKALSEKLLKSYKAKIKEDLLEPTLAVILVGDKKDSIIYVRKKQQIAREVGIKFILVHFPADIQEKFVIDIIESYNSNNNIHGIMVQLPLPIHLNTYNIVSSISPLKDVDGLNPLNLSRIMTNYESDYLAPCTPLACIELLKTLGPLKDVVEGKFVVILGRSNIVGLPLALMLMKLNADVISLDKDTKNNKKWVKKADILISATGVPGLITKEWIKPGVVVLDVGICAIRNEQGKRQIVGDVKTDEVIKKVSHISPVPGGVGPLTIAMLMKNTINCYIKIKNMY